MKLYFLLLLLWCSYSYAKPQTSAVSRHEEWHLWKQQHNKEYSSENEETLRHSIWLSNKKYIEHHNRQARRSNSYTLKMNHLGDLTNGEYQAKYATCYQKPDTLKYNSTSFTKYNALKGQNPDTLHAHLPDTVDWRTKDAVSGIKNQGQCGSCYAFSAVGALEGAHALAHDKLVRLSEQNVVDCSVPYGNHGCNGGNMYQVFHYVIDNNGIDKEDNYPYHAKQGQCSFSRDSIGGKETGIVHIPPGNEAELQLAVATAGPVSIAVDGSSNAFRFYEKGVFDEPNCSTSQVSHAMLIIGYGKENGKAYWLVKNSWGPHWGIGGYIKMAKDKANQCGIATDASFPTL